MLPEMSARRFVGMDSLLVTKHVMTGLQHSVLLVASLVAKTQLLGTFALEAQTLLEALALDFVQTG